MAYSTLFDYIQAKKPGLGYFIEEGQSQFEISWYGWADYAYEQEEYKTWGEQDQKGLAKFLSYFLEDYHEIITEEWNTGARENVAHRGVIMRSFLNKMLREEYASQQYFQNSSPTSGDNVWTSDGIKVLETLLEEKVVTWGDQAGKKVNSFWLFGKKEGEGSGPPAELFRSGQQGKWSIYSDESFYPLRLSLKNMETLTKRAERVINLWKTYTGEDTIKEDASRRLANLGWNQGKFRQSVMEEADRLVKGQVTKQFGSGQNQFQGSFRVTSKPEKLGDDNLLPGIIALSPVDWASSHNTNQKVPEHLSFGDYTDWSINLNISEQQPSVRILKESKYGVYPVEVNHYAKPPGRSYWSKERSRQKHFFISDDPKSKKELQDLTRKANVIWSNNSRTFNHQEEGIGKIDASQLANSYDSIIKRIVGGYDSWFTLDKILALKLGDPKDKDNPLKIIDNVWFRLKHILLNTAAGSLADQQKYGLKNSSVKSDNDLLQEAIGNAAYIIAFQFHFYSVLAEIYALADIIAGLEGEKITPDVINKILDKANKADAKAMSDGAGDSALSEESKLGETEIDERQVFLRQCALLMNLDIMKAACQAEFTKAVDPNTYNNRIHTVDVDLSNKRTDIVNFLTAAPYEKIGAFLKLTPELQACLVPKLRFFKVFNEQDNKDNIKEIEFTFPFHYDDDQSRYKLKNDGVVFRGAGMGVRSFSFSFEGTSPATARNDIVAELNLFFQDFNELLKYRSGDDLFTDKGKSDKYRLIDLLLLPGSNLNKKKDVDNADSLYEHFSAFNASNHRIRVDVGWVIRNDTLFKELVKNRGLTKEIEIITKKGKKKKELVNLINEALETVNKSYYLNMVDHNIDFLDDGSVELKINYRAWLESVTKQNSLDALLSPELAKDRIIMTKDYNTALENKLCEPEDLQELIGTFSAVEIEYVKRSHQSIVERLVRNNKLHYCYLDDRDLQQFKDDGYFSQTPSISFRKSASGLSTIDKNAAIKPKTVIEDESKPKAEQTTKEAFLDSSLTDLDPTLMNPVANQSFVTFFFFGDLVHTVLDCMRDPNSGPPYDFYPQFKKTKIILSSFDYVDHLYRDKNVNLSEIPISTEYFFEWMNQNVIKPKRKTYPLTYFIRDLCNKLIANLMLEQCINRSPVKTLSFKTINLLGVVDDPADPDPFTNMPVLQTGHINIAEAHAKKQGLPLRGNIGDKSLNDAYNYIAIYPVSDNQNYSGTGNFFQDGKRGIYHFGLGHNSGIVKTIKFAKTDIQYIREARFMNHGHDGLMQLSAVYKVTLEMFGNTIFYPGMLIFIDPRELGGDSMDPTKGPNGNNTDQSVANALGIGGYHLITRVNSSVESGVFTTTIEAQFVYSGDGSQGSAFKQNKENKPVSLDKSVFSGQGVTNACQAISQIYEQRLDSGNLGTQASNKRFKSIADKKLSELNKEISSNAANNSMYITGSTP